MENLISFNDLSGDFFSSSFVLYKKFRLSAAEGVEDVKHLTVKVDKGESKRFLASRPFEIHEFHCKRR